MGTMRANRYAGAAVARASIARAVIALGTAVAAILLLAIALSLLGASQSNDIVKLIHDAGKFLAGPFKGLFSLDSAKATMAVNWGLAAVVWYALARLIARLLLR